MFVVVVSVKVTPGHADQFINAVRANHEASVREPGCVRFDVLRGEPAAPNEPESFCLVEVYHRPEDFAAHRETAHFLAFQNAVADIMAEARQVARYTSVFPEPWA